MTGCAVLTVVYEAALAFVDDWIEALLVAASRAPEPWSGERLQVIVICDGKQIDHRLFSSLSQHLTTTVIDTTGSPSQLRLRLLQMGKDTGANCLVCTDVDDLLLPDALPQHFDALASADFSYGDQVLIDTFGEALGRNLYDDWMVLASLDDAEQICVGNVVGFSAFAMHSHCIDALGKTVSCHVRAFDWWLACTLLYAGFRGRRTSSAVVRYRQHDNNLLGAEQQVDEVNWTRRVNIALAHFENLPDAAPFAKYRTMLAEYCRARSQVPHSPVAPVTGPWFSDVIGVAGAFTNEGSEAN